MHVGCDDEGPRGEGPGCRVAIINIHTCIPF